MREIHIGGLEMENRDKLMESLCRLIVEVYDMLSSLAIDADF